MEPLETGAQKVQQRVQYPVHASNPARLRTAHPVLEGAAMSDPSESTDDFDLVDPRTMAVRQLLVGTMLVVVGVVVTAATYTTARHDGDRYLLAFGPIVIGVIAMVRGFIGLVRP
jgi:hypothetical protein